MSKTWKIIIFGGIGLFVLCCGGGVAGLFFVVNGSTKAPKAATGDFLTALETGKTQAAYDLLCSSAQQNYGPETFEAYVKKDPITAHDISWGGSYSNNNGHETAQIDASLTYQNAGKSSHSFDLIKESGSWKVCGNPF
ncbi:hypothetical protein ABT369_39820 [Dactylosporangium sp. NPDC000244]|uniref:Rv0361 family membrane protein n=1 Tax=Dactylosporangium sp. NPDC000244 TaxID=3154365 RepID=UPI003319CDE9